MADDYPTFGPILNPVLEKTEHASAILLSSVGILVRGPSGSGKSLLCHTLIERFHQAGRFARWVCDDRAILEPSGQKVIAKCPCNIAGLAEMRFGGIRSVPHHPKCVLDMVVDLVDRETLERLPEAKTVTLIQETTAIPLILTPFDDLTLAQELVLDRVHKRFALIE